MKALHLYIFLLVTSILSELHAQNGIQFFHGSWETAKKEAIQKEQLIFVDFYTQWCGPCLNMAETVFTQDEVGSFYNRHFVNLKIDAEKGEGKTLAAQYRVSSYPTFLFIDPKTELVVHYSASRQEAETFLFTGHSAIDSQRNSVYLNQQLEKGNKSVAFLLDYASYMASMNKNEQAEAIMKEVQEKGTGLADERMWSLFSTHVRDLHSPFVQDLFRNKARYVNIYGEEVVDDKLFSLLSYVKDLNVFDEVPDFEGKEYLFKKNKAIGFVNGKEYTNAIAILDELMAQSGDYAADLCDYLKQQIRFLPYQNATSEWKQRCLVYAQFVAYNYPDRKDGMAHYNYAMLLESIIRTMPNASEYFPQEIVKGPQAGNPEYTMRSPKLKAKPGARKR